MSEVKWKRIGAGLVVAAAVLGGSAVAPMQAPVGTDVAPVVLGLDPWSLYNSAQQRFADGAVADGLAQLRRSLTLLPDDRQALSLQAIWADQISDGRQRDAALNRLARIDPAAAATARTVIAGVTRAAAIVPSPTPVRVGGRPAIVVLGYGLEPDGTMRPELQRRVDAAVSQAERLPESRIVVTGGNPQNGVTEAAAMRAALLDAGIDPGRILVEDSAVSTPANAQRTAALLSRYRTERVILATSPSHIRRAAADFGAAGLEVVGSVTTETDLEKHLEPLPRERQTGIRVEATRTAGLPATRSPFEPGGLEPLFTGSAG